MIRLLLAVVLLAVAPPTARAHAVLLQSKPAAGETLDAGPAVMTFRFNSRIDRARSKLELIGPDGTAAPLAISDQGDPDSMQTSAQLQPGAYSVRWQVLSLDGHITRGTVPFSVAAP